MDRYIQFNAPCVFLRALSALVHSSLSPFLFHPLFLCLFPPLCLPLSLLPLFEASVYPLIPPSYAEYPLSKPCDCSPLCKAVKPTPAVMDQGRTRVRITAAVSNSLCNHVEIEWLWFLFCFRRFWVQIWTQRPAILTGSSWVYSVISDSLSTAQIRFPCISRGLFQVSSSRLDRQRKTTRNLGQDS